MKTESIWFKVEAVQGCHEFAPNKFIFYARNAHLFIVHDWKVVRKIDDKNLKNINKYYIDALPGFHPTNFPFVACSGESSINIINVNTGYMDVLVGAAPSALHQQKAFFFMNDDTGTVSMHFSTTKLTEDNNTMQNWHIMKFKSDFFDTLQLYGRLPYTTPAQGLELYLEN